MANIVDVQNLVKIYKRKTVIPGLFNYVSTKRDSGKNEIIAVNGIDLRIEEGEFFGLLGPNGAGKTTTILMLTTLTKPTAGIAKICGYNVVTESQKVRENIGYVSQDTIIDNNLTARENLEMVAGYYNVDKRVAKERIGQFLELVGLTERANELVKTYSGGMKRKLEIISALVHIPKLLFLDEPTLGLDPKSRRLIWEHLRMLSREYKISIFLTTHYLEEADTLCDRVAVIDHGTIKTVGSPESLKKEIKEDTIMIQLIEKDAGNRFLQKVKENSWVKHANFKEDAFYLTVDNAEARIPDIVGLIREMQLNASNLTVSKPTLDDVFLKYSGRGFQDDESENLKVSQG